MRINNVTHLTIQPIKNCSNRSLINNEFTGFSCDLKVCDTIEEALLSFDKVKEQREIEARKPFKYKG